jgi:hypothetical protein
MARFDWDDVPTQTKIAWGVALALLIASPFIDAPRRHTSDRELFSNVLLVISLIVAAAGSIPLLKQQFLRYRSLFGEREPEGDPRPVLAELARVLKGNAGSTSFEGAFRGRRVQIDVVRDGLFGRRYEIRLETHLGAPTSGRVDGIEAFRELLKAGLATDSPFGRSLVENDVQWSAIFRVYHVESVDFGHGFVHARASWGGGVLASEDEATRILRLLERLAVVSEARGLELHARPGVQERCPYCHDTLETTARETWACPSCGTRQHAECTSELGGCSVLGCKARARPASARVE